MRDINGPFFTNNTDEVESCIKDSECDTLQEIIGDLGKILSLTYILIKFYVADVNNVSRELALHPVHLKPDAKGNLPPSVLVPFCFYQGNGNMRGQKRGEPLNLRFCDKFEPTILEGQLCHSLNITKFEGKPTKTGRKSGLLLLMDPIPYLMKTTAGSVKNARNDQELFKVYIHTLAGHTAFGPGAYAMQTLKKMTGKPSFYEMQDSKKECQVHSREKCQTELFLNQVNSNCSCVSWALGSGNDDNKVMTLSFINIILINFL